MFTSRAEYRLLLGVDTASRRLGPHGRRIGLLDAARAEAEAEMWRRIDRAVERLEGERWVPDEPTRARMKILEIPLEHPASTAELLRRPGIDPLSLVQLSPTLAGLATEERRIASETIRYAGYVQRQRREAARVARNGARRIPDDFAYRGLSGLSNELVEKLETVRPGSIGHASRIDGMTPAALSLLAAHLERRPEPLAR